jgi:hypothetical protein
MQPDADWHSRRFSAKGYCHLLRSLVFFERVIQDAVNELESIYKSLGFLARRIVSWEGYDLG